jgi:hypothetical protein
MTKAETAVSIVPVPSETLLDEALLGGVAGGTSDGFSPSVPFVPKYVEKMETALVAPDGRLVFPGLT